MIDSHCHLNFNELAENFHNIINNSKLNNITSILSINTDPEDFEDHLNLIKNYNSVYLHMVFILIRLIHLIKFNYKILILLVKMKKL